MRAIGSGWALAVLGLVLGGCATHVRPFTTHYRLIQWAETYEAAQVQASATGKPLLVILAAGPRDGRC